MQYSWGTNNSKIVSQLVQSKQGYSTTGTSRFGASCQLKCIFKFLSFSVILMKGTPGNKCHSAITDILIYKNIFGGHRVPYCI